MDDSQLWCVASDGNPCDCPPKANRQGRGHVQSNGPAGTVRNLKTCYYLKASVPTAGFPGDLTLVEVKTKMKDENEYSLLLTGRQ